MNDKNTSHKTQTTIYDTTLKDIVKQQVRDILPVLLPGAIYEATINVELIRPTLRADKAFRIWHEGEEKILNVEFESGFDEDMPARLLLYNALLYKDHSLPVISLIVYPFRTKMATPPLLIASSGKDILIFHFSVLPLFLEDAERYVTEHVQCMYPLLPTMRGANQQLIKQAIDELVTLYRDDEVTLAQQIIWMELLLERTTTVSKKEKQKVREVLSMYDSLWEENPKVRQIKAKAAEEGHRQGLNEGLKEGLNEGRKEGLNEGRKEGLTEGFTKGRVESSQELVMKIVRRRFPRLVEPAMQRIAQIRSYEALDMLMDQLLDAPDETTARIVLRLPVA